MPRRDGNNPASRHRRRPRHSARKGSGGDRKLKEQKKLLGATGKHSDKKTRKSTPQSDAGYRLPGH